MTSKSSDVEKFVKEHSDAVEILENGKLRFTATGMEFSSSVKTSVLESYLNGRAMRRAVALKYDYDQYKPFLIAHRERDERHFLFCTLTGKTVPRIPEKVEQHTNGKRYKRLKEETLKKIEQRRKRNEKLKLLKMERRKNRETKADLKISENNNDDKDKGQNGVDDGDGDGDVDVDATLDAIMSDSSDEENHSEDENEDEDEDENDDNGNDNDDDNNNGEERDDADIVNDVVPSTDDTDVGMTEAEQPTSVPKQKSQPPPSSPNTKIKNPNPNSLKSPRTVIKPTSNPSPSSSSLEKKRARANSNASLPRKVLRARQIRKKTSM